MEKLTQTSSVEADSKTDLSATIKDWLHDVWLVSSDKSEFIKIRMKINAFLTPNIFMSKSKAKLCSKSSKEHFFNRKIGQVVTDVRWRPKATKRPKKKSCVNCEEHQVFPWLHFLSFQLLLLTSVKKLWHTKEFSKELPNESRFHSVITYEKW
mgnify:CR=1 FL=1